MTEAKQVADDLITQLEEEGSQRATHIRNYVEWCDDKGLDPADVNRGQVKTYLRELNSQHTDSTARRKYWSINKLYRELADWRVIEDKENFVPDTKSVRNDVGISFKRVEKVAQAEEGEVVYITPEEKERLVDPENLPAPTDRNRLLIELMWTTGVRVKELVNIKLDHVDREERSIKIWSAKKQDSENKTRTVWYPARLDDLMNLWIDVQREGYKTSDSPYLFNTQQSDKINPKWVNDHVVVPAAKNAGIQEVLYEDSMGRPRHKVTCHCLRHSFAVWSVKRTDDTEAMDIKTLQKLMGHESLDTTRQYLRFREDDNKQEMRRCSPR